MRQHLYNCPLPEMTPSYIPKFRDDMAPSQPGLRIAMSSGLIDVYIFVKCFAMSKIKQIQLLNIENDYRYINYIINLLSYMFTNITELHT